MKPHLLLASALSLAACQPVDASPPTAAVAPAQITAALAPLMRGDAVRNVRYAMEPPFTEHPVAMRADQLRRYGCRYETDDPDRIAALAARLREAVVSAAPAGHESRELRQVLDIDFVDGSTLTLEFGEVFPPDSVLRGSANGLDVTARRSLQVDLFRWAGSLPAKPEKCRRFMEDVD